MMENVVDSFVPVKTKKVGEWVVSIFNTGNEFFARVEGPGFRIQGPTQRNILDKATGKHTAAPLTREEAEEWAEEYIKEYAKGVEVK